MRSITIVRCFVVLLSAAGRLASAAMPQFGTFDSGGVKIAYVTAGSGEPVVLVHGLQSSADLNWQLPGTFALLAEHYHVIAMDLRGHGRSDKPESEDAYGEPMVQDIVGLMDQLKIEKAHVVGYSLGGIIVMKFMVEHPDRVISGMLGGMGWLREGSALQAFFERVPATRESSRTPLAVVHGISKLAITEAQLRGIKLPVEVLVGDRDPCKRLYVEPLEMVRKDWPVVEIQDAGHLNCVAKEQFKQELAKWIAKNCGSAPKQ
ncbi:MAG TPA: alpha/beta hydrolase [Tepidisphaeraceae bacterium]